MQEYEVDGPDGKYTVQLDDDEAKALGLVKAKKAAAPKNKAKKAVSNKKA